MTLQPAPETRMAGPQDLGDFIARRRTPMGEYLGAQLETGFDFSLAGALVEQGGRLLAKGGQPLSAEEWHASPHYRERLQFREGMTEGEAEYLADEHDDRRYREWITGTGVRDDTVGRRALGFGANIVGGAVSPENFIPFVGPATRAAAAAKFGFIGGRAAVGAADAAIGTAATAPFVHSSAAMFGDDVSFADVGRDVSMAVLTGGMFGAAAGGVERMVRRPDLNDVQRARVAVDLGRRQIEAGEAVAMPQTLGDALRQRTAELHGLEPTPIDGPNSVLMDIDPTDPRGDLMRSFVQWRDKRVQRAGKRYARVGERLRGAVRGMGLRIDDGYEHTISAQHYRHIMANHGDPVEAARRGHDPVTDDDLARLPDIADAFDEARRTTTNDGHDAISYLRRDEVGTAYYVEEVRTGRKALSLKTFMVWRGGKGPKTLSDVPGFGGRERNYPGGPVPKNERAGVSDENVAGTRLLDAHPEPTAKPGLTTKNYNTQSAAGGQPATMADFASDLDQTIRRINPNVSTEFLIDIGASGKKAKGLHSIDESQEAFARGSFDKRKALIRVAMIPPKKGAFSDLEFTALHEAFHSIQKYLSDEEWIALHKAFGGGKEHIVEASANAFAAYARNRSSVPAAARPIFDKIRALFDAVRDYWTGHGFRTAEQVDAHLKRIDTLFDDAYQGRIAARAEDGRTPGATRIAEGLDQVSAPNGFATLEELTPAYLEPMDYDARPRNEGGDPVDADLDAFAEDDLAGAASIIADGRADADDLIVYQAAEAAEAADANIVNAYQAAAACLLRIAP